MMNRTNSRNSNHKKHTPERSCTVCRVKSDKNTLIRIVKSPDGKAVIDIAKKLQGRGVYICPDADCIAKARKSGILAKALGTDIKQDFWDELSKVSANTAVNKDLKLKSILGLAKKSGTLIIGTDNIERDKRSLLVMTASDCSDNVRNFAQSKEYISLNLNTEELSKVIGSRGGVQIVALPLTPSSSGFSKSAKLLMSLYSVKGDTLFE